TVGLTVEGIGQSGLRMTQFFFELLNERGYPTHYLRANIDHATMTVKRAKMFGQGLEVICRFRAVGSFYRRYARYCEEGQSLDGLVEVTIKDDERGDPPISKDALVDLNIVTATEYDEIKRLTKNISTIVKNELMKKELELYDIKLEFGYDDDGKIMLIDEISAGNMRVYKDGKSVSPFELERILFA
ncbi:MAG TPA: phosphoribosylaminoimidazolesuccinocarboxamide synthase, partial [Bacillota bacterium]|nr:phosphoribosylaminoimidazolesuccinocarboxamide synthase [Bacillota bacterium]